MKKAVLFLIFTVVVVLFAGCAQTEKTVPRQRMAMGVPHGKISYKPISSEGLELRRFGKTVFRAGRPAVLTFALANNGYRKIACAPARNRRQNRFLRKDCVFLWQNAHRLGFSDIGQLIVFGSERLRNNHFGKSKSGNVSANVKGNVSAVSLQTDLRIGRVIQVFIRIRGGIISQQREIRGSCILNGQAHRHQSCKSLAALGSTIFQNRGIKGRHAVVLA